MNARTLAHSNDNRPDPFTAASPQYLAARATHSRRSVAFEITHRPIMALPPLSVFIAGAAVWAFVIVVIVGVVAVSG